MGLAVNESSIPQIVALLLRLSRHIRHQSRTESLEVVESAHAHFDETNYDIGWWNLHMGLMLELPVHIFASIEPRLEQSKGIGANCRT